LKPIEHLGLYVSPKLLSDELNFPRRSPEKNLFIAESQGKIVGFCELIPEINIGRVLANALVDPDHRRRGIGSALFEAALFRVRELAADIVHVDILETNEAAKWFLSGHGFKIIRRHCALQMNLACLGDYEGNRIPFTIRPMQEGEEHRLVRIQNRSFTGSWGFHPNTVEEIIYMINLSDCSPEDVLLTFEGDCPVGYCWTRVNRDANQRSKIKKGRIHMIGVDPDHRGRGIGKLTLCAGLKKLKAEGIEVAELTTDSKNQSALRLYQSTGFMMTAGILWYEKTL
jgi:mycothiol synthase